jgi:hypothetical protein
MKIFGYEVSEGQNDTCEPAELAEITLNATPDELRRISKFLTDVADQMSGWKDKTHHRHLSDVDKSFQSSPHFVVYLSR